MPFKSEEAMKEAINGLEMAVGNDKWCQRAFTKVTKRERVPVVHEISPKLMPDVTDSVSLFMTEERCEYAHCALGTIVPEYAEKTYNARGYGGSVDAVTKQVARKTGLNMDEMARTMELNDIHGHRAVIDYWRSLGFDSGC